MAKRLVVFATLLILSAVAFGRESGWIEVRSAHFIVVTNAGEKQARTVADQFERMRAVFRRAFPGLPADSAAPITVLAAKSEKDFRDLQPESYLQKGQLKLAGLFLNTAERQFILLRLDATSEQHPFATVYHEYTHFLTRKTQEWMPLWLNEGLAQFYENTTMRDKEVTLGEPSAVNIHLLRQTRMLPLAQLFTVDHSSPYYHEDSKGTIFYAQSWALVHYLLIKDFRDKTSHVGDYVKLVSQQVDPVTAATRAFGDLQLLQKELAKYLGQSSYGVFRMLGAVAVEDAEVKVRALTAAQDAAARGEFLAYSNRAADARVALQAALQEDSDNVAALEAMGYLEFRAGHPEEARHWYERAVKLDSSSYMAHYFFAVIAMSSLEGDGREEEIEKSLRIAIRLNPSFAPAHDRLAAFFAMRRHKPDEAYLLAVTAVQLEPANLGYRLNYANILAMNERLQDAVNVTAAALKVARTPEEVARVERYLHQFEKVAASRAAFAEQQKRMDLAAASAPPSAPIADQVEPGGDASPASLGPRVASRGKPRVTTGTIRNVKCSAPARMVFQLAARDGVYTLQTENYYRVEFSALGYQPVGELLPCTQLEARTAQVEFLETEGKTGQVKAVELRK